MVKSLSVWDNPSEPTGMKDATRSAERDGGGSKFAGGLSVWRTDAEAQGDGGYVDRAQTWWSGANASSTESGWNTEFYKNFQENFTSAMEQGTAAEYFTSGGSGVVLWDHEGYEFGDVVEGGKVTGKLYDQYDRNTANLMLLPLVADGKTIGRLVDTADQAESARRIDEFVRGVHEENNANLEKAASAQAFQSDLDTTEKGLAEGASKWGVVGAATAGGAATGAALSAWLGPGALVGAAVGGIVGGVGALLNQDELIEQTARATEITKLAFEENDPWSATGTALGQAGQLASKFALSPLTNLSHGVTDLVEGDIGDLESARYAVNDKGESTTSKWSIVADVAAAVGDGLLQFASPTTRMAYTGTMGSSIGGEAIQLSTTGEMFDPREGGFDNIFLDDDGNIDLGSAAAGLAKIGIDVVQLAGWRGLASQSGATKGAASGQRMEDLAGHKFTFDADGKVVGMNKTAAILAPSEAIAWGSVARDARIMARKRGAGEVATYDDYYRAAHNLANGSSKLKTAVVNSMGEAYEEGAQYLLEAVALDGDIEGSELWSSALYGAAGGLGMSLAATMDGADSDAALFSQAYALETVRREGVEPDLEAFRAEWQGLNPMEKKVRAARSEQDLALLRAANVKIREDQAATLVENSVDAAKVFDAKQTRLAKELSSGDSAINRTDTYTVISGLVDVGAVNSDGSIGAGDAATTAPPEAIEASGVTVLEMLHNRLEGLAQQEEFLGRQLATLDPDDTEGLAETTEQLSQATLARQFGEGLLQDVAKALDWAYEDGRTEAQITRVVRNVNAMLARVYYRQEQLRTPEDFTGSQEEWADAAAQFVTILHSREPKLDTGSYVAMLPRISEKLTLQRDDNVLLVNTDILRAINGDFDGDKMRSENQLILTRERFLQTRAGQNLTGVEEGIDIAERNFEKALVSALSKGLHGEGTLHTTAMATMKRIRNGLEARYAKLMSAEAFESVWMKYEAAVLGNVSDARNVLLNSLAEAASESITNQGRETLTNEWLWASKIVRANVNAYQLEYRRLRNLDANGNPISGPSPEEAVEDMDTPEGTNIRKQRAATDAQTLSLFAAGNNLFRKFQKIHYTWFASRAEHVKNAAKADLTEMAEFYRELAKNITASELELVQAQDPVTARVMVMLNRIVEAAQDDPDVAALNSTAAMTLLANVKVKDVRELSDGQVVVARDNVTLLQALMARALDAERELHKRTWSQDTALQAKHAKLRAMTLPNDVTGQPSAERAFLEVFKAVPFHEALGGNTGHLSAHTTPEQWLDTFNGMDNRERAQHEQHFKNVPEHLDRKQSTNIPYSMHEMERGEITPYRVMLDAMLAVGHNEITFDPSKDGAEAFGGRLAQQDKASQDAVINTFKLVRDAFLEYVGLIEESDRTPSVDKVREMFAQNPRQAKTLLDMIPNAYANAIYEEKDDGSLRVAPWVYKMFTIENPNEALFYYWKNLLLARWNSELVNRRQYDKMDSRTMRLMYRLAAEPGQFHLEMLIRKLDTETDLNDFMVWLNKTPGFRQRGEAVFLPFVDDVVDFDSDERGAFSAGSPGTDYRKALSDAAAAAEQLRDSIAFRKETRASNRAILEDIKAARDGDPDPAKQRKLEKLEKALEVARRIPRTFSPTAMMSLTHGALQGVDPGSHAKGTTASSYEDHGNFQALMDAFAFVPGFERIMGELTAYDLAGLRNNLNDTVRTSGTTMDPKTGQQITWSPLTLDEAIDLLDDPKTEQFAFALLSPAALDVTPVGLAERLMNEPSLEGLLSGKAYKEMFSRTGEASLDADMRYLSTANAMLRAEGGNDDVIRAANNLAIIYTSSLGRPLTEQDRQELTAKAYRNVAKVMRLVGQLMTGPQGAEAVERLRKTAKDSLEGMARAKALPLFVDSKTGEVVEEFVNLMIREVEEWKLTTIKEISQSNMPTPQKLRKIAAVQAEEKQTVDEMKGLLSGRRLETIVSKFEMTGDELVDAPRKAMLEQYVTSMSSFPNRAPEAAEAWEKLTGQRRDGEPVDLEESEWDTLARAAMGLTLMDSVTRVARHVSVPSFPEAAKPADGNGDPAISLARFYKFMDPDFLFIADDLLDPSSPLSTVAMKLHVLAEQPRVRLDYNQQVKVLKQTVLDRELIGTWDPGLFAQLVATEERMDSAAAPPGIAAAGNGPKRWAWIAAALRRSGAVPDASFLTTAKFSAAKLLPGADLFNQISVQPAKTVNTVAMPVAQLENRFFASIKFNGTEIPLDQDNLGFSWAGADDPNPYRYVSLERLRPILTRFAKANNLKLADIEIEATFFHPDSQPADAWSNAFFEGMSHSTAPDTSESLIGSLMSDNGGQISKDTQWTIDAGKKGLRAIQPFLRPDAETQLEINRSWARDRDMAAMLRRKAEYIVSYDDGSGAAGPAAFNAVYKILKAQHMVAGVDAEGNPVAWTADEVIAFQAENGTNAAFPFDTTAKGNHGLVLLSPEVVRSIMGDTTSGQGLTDDFATELYLNPTRVRRFEGIRPETLKRFGKGWASPSGRLVDTDLVHVGPQRVLSVRPVETDEARKARETRRVYLQERYTKAHDARFASRLQEGAAQTQYQTVLTTAVEAVNTETIRFSVADKNSGLVIPRDVAQSAKTERLLNLLNTIKGAQGLERGWLVRREGSTNHSAGVLTLTGMRGDPEREEHWVVKDDLAFVDIENFITPETTHEEQLTQIEEALNFLVERGAYIVLGSGKGMGDLRFEASKHLEERGYEPVEGSAHLYRPIEFSTRTQNQKAYDSTQRETRTITPATQAITFLATDPLELDENAAMYNEESSKLKTRILVSNLLPSNRYRHYNLPIDDGRDDGQYARVLRHLKHVLNPTNVEARKELLAAAGDDPRGVKEFSQALDDYYALISSTGKLVPPPGHKLEVGDVIPFVHTDGRVILYRHGIELPRKNDLKKAFEKSTLGIAVPVSKREKAATVNSGVIRQIDTRPGAGRRLVLEVPVQSAGEKVHLEWNGMKYVLVPTEKKLFAKIPPLFRNGTLVDLISDVASANSKEAYEGRVQGLRNALAFFQFNFLDDMVRFFDPSFDPTAADAEDARTVVLTFLTDLSKQSDARIPFTHAEAIAKHGIAVAEMYGSLLDVEDLVPPQLGSDWVERLESPLTATDQIAQAVLTYLLTPGANVDNILSSAGFSAPNAVKEGATTRLVPGLFADLLDQGVESELHRELIRRFNLQLMKGDDGSRFELNSDWTVTMHDGTGKTLNGYLQFGEAHSSGDSPVLNGQAYNPEEPASISLHNILAAATSLGATTVHSPLTGTQEFIDSFRTEGAVYKFDPDNDDGVWAMLTYLPDNKDRSQTPWRWEAPAETLRRAAAREEIAGLHKDLNTEHWDDPVKEADYREKARALLKMIGLPHSNGRFVDTWVRQMLGRPFGMDEQGNDLSLVSYDDAIQVLGLMRSNVEKGLLPVAGGNIPLMDVNHLTAIYMSNLTSGKWAPRTATAEGSPLANSWDSWVETAFGTAWIVEEGTEGIGTKPQFHAMYLLAIDGIMHGYQNATTETRYLPVSSDTLRSRLLMDETTNKMLVSISADTNTMATDPMLYNSREAELEQLIVGERIYAPGRNGPNPESAMGRVILRHNRWHKETGAPRQVDKDLPSIRQAGAAFVGYTTSTNTWFRSMMNLRVGNTLFNASLITAAPVDAFYRRTINAVANTATGDSSGLVGRSLVGAGEAITDRLDASTSDFGKRMAELWRSLGFTSEGVHDQMVRTNNLARSLASLPDFKAMIYGDLFHHYPSVPGIGTIEKWLESYAKLGGKLQDPALGMLPGDLARIYLDTAIKQINQNPTGDVMFSVDMLLAQLKGDPTWLSRAHPEVHQMAVAAVANVRSLKPNVLSLGIRGIVEPLSTHPSFAVNSFGNMLKLLTAFQNFWANWSVQVMGLQGAADFMAFWLDGREKSKLVARAQAAIGGKTYNPDTKEYYDLSEALESVDLADAFIRGGVTHTALFALGMMAGGLGLSGEDDETKFRRRQAELQGVGMLYDPSQMENDFRNKDAIFLDWLPMGLDSFFRADPSNPESRSLAQMNWVARTFLSPIIGFERFYNSGDFSEIIHGFKDAIGSHPIVNQTLWNIATDTAAELQTAANDSIEAGDIVDGGHKLMTAVGVLERMLFENAMVNMIYVGRDEWDRDPYVLPLRDSDGILQRDIQGQVRENDLALQSFINDKGEVQQGYLGRSDAGAQARVMTENRATMAFVASLFSGGIGDSDFWRYNMPIKTREIEKNEISEETAELYIKAAAAFQMGLTKQPNVTAEEMVGSVRNELYQLGDSTGQFFTDDQVWSVARQRAGELGLLHMSIMDESGREHLTTDGARAIFDGLLNGSITLGSEDMAGVYIPSEMRTKIAADWSKELVQEGINLGLDETKAVSRMKRIMYGNLQDPEASEGLADLLMSNAIPRNSKQVYGQLNTTYVMGPDGRPWATGFKRDAILGALGIAPLKRMTPPDPDVTRMDDRGNTVDLVNGNNTGLRALVPFDDSRNVPTDKELADAIIKAIEDAGKEQYTPFPPFEKKGGSSWRNFGRGGYGRSYGGGGYSSGGGYFSKMYALPRGSAPYNDSTPFINTSNPILRRSTVRRERVWSERGRLKQWQ